jgi:hypothetical protein
MILSPQRPRKNNRFHAGHRDTSSRHHAFKCPTPNQDGVELAEYRSEIEIPVYRYPIGFAVWSRNITVQAHRY